MREKTVSIVVCTFNGSRYLRPQLDSLLAQTYPVAEIIVQDDGSTDDTMSILADYAANHPSIKVFSNQGPHGINANFYSAMRRASSQWIALCDQDDVWEPQKIERQMAAIGHHLLCAGRSVPFSADGSFVHDDGRRPNTTLLRMLYCAEIAGHTMLLNRRLLDMVPMQSAVCRNRCYDIVLSVAAAAYGSIQWIDEVLVHQRRYASANTYTSVEDSLPTAHNGIRMLRWCLRHYADVKRRSAGTYRDWEEFLTLLGADNPVARDGIRMMQLQQSSRLTDVLKLTLFCARHREEILHTKGRFPQNLIRAVLFPLTSCYYQRAVVLKESK